MPAAKQPPAVQETTTLTYLQQALDDLDKAREKAGEDARDRIDAAGDRIRATLKDVRERAEHAVDEWEEMLERSSEDIRRQLGVMAIRTQQSEASLSVLSREIRQRRAALAARDA